MEREHAKTFASRTVDETIKLAASSLRLLLSIRYRASRALHYKRR